MTARAAVSAVEAQKNDAGSLPAPLADALDAIARNFPTELCPVKIFLFGSRAEGTSDSRSDFDIGIEAARPIDAGTMTGIRDRLDAVPILQKIDVVDFQRVTPSFREVALRYRIRIHD